MKQVLQNLKTGVIEVADVPCPNVRPGHVLIQTRASLISAGTERSLIEFGKASLIAKARARPDKVRQVLTKIKTDGFLPTLETVFTRLDEPFPLGYCNTGVVLEVGDDVEALTAQLKNAEMRVREAWQNAEAAESDYSRARTRRYPRE